MPFVRHWYQSHNSERAKQYDWYQWRTNGIVP